jgi:NADPH2:quinone reductase
MFNATAAMQQPCAEAINRWVDEGKLKPLVGRTFPLAEAAAAEKFLEENTLGGAGKLSGKVVIAIDGA